MHMPLVAAVLGSVAIATPTAPHAHAQPEDSSSGLIERDPMLTFTGFRTSPSQPDGVYQALLLENGTQVHTRLSGHPLADEVVFRGPALHSRQADTLTANVTCAHGGALMPHKEVAAALAELGSQCDEEGSMSIVGRGSTYVKKGETVAYVCNYSPNHQACTSEELNHAIKGWHEDGGIEVAGVQDTCKNKAGV